MFITNSKIIIHKNNDADALNKAVRTLERYLYEETGTEAKFLLDDTVVYPCYLVPSGINYADMDAALRPKIMYRAINDDSVVLPDEKFIMVKHHFSEEEKEQIAKDVMKKTLERNRLQARAKSSAAQFNAQIKELNEEVDNHAAKYDAGHEEREYECNIRLDFANGVKQWIDAGDADLIHKTEPLEDKDKELIFQPTRQLFLDTSAAGEIPEPGTEQPEPDYDNEPITEGEDEAEHEEYAD